MLDPRQVPMQAGTPMTAETHASPLRAYVLLTLTALCWGANAVLGRVAVGEISPMALVSARWFGVVLLVAVFAREPVRRDWHILKTRLVYLAAMGTLGFSIFNGMFYVAAHYATAVNIGIIQGSIPVYVLIGVFVIHRTPVTKLQLAGVLVTMAGVATVASAGDLQRLSALAIGQGEVLVVAACLLYAGYTVGLRSRPAVSSLGLFTVMAGAAFLVSLPMVGAEIVLGQFQAPTPLGWLVVVLVALFPSLLGQIFFMQGVEMIGPGRAGLFVNLVPVFAAILGVVILSEPFETYHGAALGMVLGGIWLAERGNA